MRNKVTAVVSIGLIVAGTILSLWALGPMVEFGTCASGGPYQIERECPAAYDWLFWLILGGFVLVFAGLITLAITNGVGHMFVAMGAWFALCGVMAIATATSLSGDSRLGLNIVGYLFVPLGLGFAVFGYFSARSEHRQRSFISERKAPESGYQARTGWVSREQFQKSRREKRRS